MMASLFQGRSFVPTLLIMLFLLGWMHAAATKIRQMNNGRWKVVYGFGGDEDDEEEEDTVRDPRFINANIGSKIASHISFK